MKLYGTTTSPYVRRVRVVAEMVDTPIELIDTSTDEGQAKLRELSPIWKVPVIEADDHALFDSRVITEYLVLRSGEMSLRADSAEAWLRETNLVTVIDGALDAAINSFYLRKDGAAEVAYMEKQDARVSSAMAWVEARLVSNFLGGAERLGIPEVALFTTLDWMRFRNAYSLEAHPLLCQFLEAHRDFAPFASTRPGE